MASFSSIGVGLGGNVDVNALIQASVDAVKMPITRTNGIKSQTEFTQAKISSFGQVQSLVSTLQQAAGKLASLTGWNAVAATSSNDKAITASAIGGTVETTFSVEVSQLAKAQVATSGAISSGPVGAGTLTLETGRWDGGSFIAGSGAAVNVEVKATDTLGDIVGKINSSNAGVTATIVTDSGGQRLMLRSKNTGEAAGFQMTVTDTDGNLGDGSGLSRLANGLSGDPGANAGTDAKARINGLFDVSSSSNTFENAVAGVTFKAMEVTTAPVDITVAKDAAGAKKNIEDFVVAYNAANQALNDLTKFDKATGVAGILQGDSTAVALQNQLRNAVQSISSSKGLYQSLSSIGLGMIEGGGLSIDNTKLDAALKNPDAVKELFIGSDGNSTTTDGVAEKIKATTSQLLDSGGFFSSKDKQLKAAIARNDKEVERINARADKTEELLKARYTALDTQMSKLNALNAYIAQQVTTWNNQKG